MAWARVDDGWWAHPKVMTLSLAARGLWVSALSWSCHQRKDVVPCRFLAIVDAGSEEAEELVDVGLWIVVEGGWRIHDWADYQEKTVSEKRAESGSKGGKASARTRRSKQTSEANGKQNGFAAEANGQAGTRPDPTHPDPALPVPSDDVASTDDDDLQSVGPSSVVVEVAHAMAELLWTHSGVHPSKHTPWVKSTEANIAAERALEIDQAALLWAHLDAQALADGLVNDRWPSLLRAVPPVDDRPWHGPIPPPKPAVSQDEHIANVRARAAQGDEAARIELDVWEKRLARKAALDPARLSS